MSIDEAFRVSWEPGAAPDSATFYRDQVRLVRAFSTRRAIECEVG